MKITTLLLCVLMAATVACGVTKTAAVDAGDENARDARRETVRSDENEKAEKTFGENGENSEPAAQSADLTGVYEFKSGNRANEIRVLQISDGVLKVSFLGNSEFESQMGPMANSGVISARKIQLEAGSRALLTDEADAPDCMIFLTFKGNRLEARQKNDCGFPNGVSADGIYRKTSDKPPTFDFDEEPSADAFLEKEPEDARNNTAFRIRFKASENSE